MQAEKDVAWWVDVVGVDLVRVGDETLFRVLEWGGMEVLVWYSIRLLNVLLILCSILIRSASDSYEENITELDSVPEIDIFD
jgi:hypothetical protein